MFRGHREAPRYEELTKGDSKDSNNATEKKCLSLQFGYMEEGGGRLRASTKTRCLAYLWNMYESPDMLSYGEKTLVET